MGRILVALLLVISAAQASSAETLSPRAFTERAAKAFKAAAPKAAIRVLDDNEIDYLAPDGLHRILVLKSAYRMYAQDPKSLDEVIQLYVTRTLERFAGKPSSAQQVDRTRIVPTIRTRQWVDDLQRSYAAKGQTVKFLIEDFTDDLVVVYAEDGNERMRYLLASEDVGERSELRRLAMRNLARIAPKARFHDPHEAVTAIEAGGDYESSLLLFDKAWAGRFDGSIKVDGDIVVGIPTRNTLVVTGSRSPVGLEILRAIVAEAYRGPEGLTDTLFIYRDGRFQKFGR